MNQVSNYDQSIEAMLRTTGEWVTLCAWDADGATYDADGWLEMWGDRVGRGQAPLPCGGFVDLTNFCAVRKSE